MQIPRTLPQRIKEIAAQFTKLATDAGFKVDQMETYYRHRINLKINELIDIDINYTKSDERYSCIIDWKYKHSYVTKGRGKTIEPKNGFMMNTVFERFKDFYSKHEEAIKKHLEELELSKRISKTCRELAAKYKKEGMSLRIEPASSYRNRSRRDTDHYLLQLITDEDTLKRILEHIELEYTYR